MIPTLLRAAAALAIAIFPLAGARAQQSDSNTSPPSVVVPHTTPAPQTPAYPQAPVGTEGGGPAAPIIAPRAGGARAPYGAAGRLR
jgi:hypothetical protein